MLVQLSIRDLVLIDRVDLEPGPGLTTLTGETGAGKSILLDALDLVLGGRAEATLVRAGAVQAMVTALFRLAAGHPVFALLAELGLDVADDCELVLRRLVRADGGSRAYVNEQPVAVGMLRSLAPLLVEIHGQHDERGLLSPRGHMQLLDQFGALEPAARAVAEAWAALADARAAHAAAMASAEAAAREREWFEHAAAELRQLAPRPGEETELADLRGRMQREGRLREAIEAVVDLLHGADGALGRLRQAARRVERISGEDPDLAPVLEALDTALAAGEAAEEALAQVQQRQLASPQLLEEAEARLFELRAMARKHRVDVEGLAALAADVEARLEQSGDMLALAARLETAVSAAADVHRACSEELHRARVAAGAALDAAVNAELPALKLGSARFRTRIEPAEPGPAGIDQVQFEIATNQGPFGPLTRIASGGELSRFILSLKVALAGAGAADTLVFDEIDRGVGGAVASAIGQRLARLAGIGAQQLLVVTHSPQVAAAGAAQLLIEKQPVAGSARTAVRRLDRAERVAEIARMLSGAMVTPEAMAQAERLLAGG